MLYYSYYLFILYFTNIFMLFNLNLWNNYELLIYSLQQKVASVLFLKITSITPLTSIIFFLAGLLTSLTPCLISILPLAISYINANNKLKIDKNFLILGLFTNLLLIIVSSNFVSYNYLFYLTRLPFISFFILFIISLNLLQIINLPSIFRFLSFKNTNFFNKKMVLNSYLTGLIIGFSSLPCSTPIVVLVNFWLYHTNEPLLFLFFLLVYLLGFFLPFLLIFSIFIDYLKLYLVSFFWNIINPLIGFIILTISLLFFFQKIFI